MRRVILQEFVSLDGHAAASDGSVDFVPAAMSGDQSFGQRQLGFIDSVDTMLLGRKTYELFAGHWPNVTSGEDRDFAEKINALNKVVFSTTLDRAPWGKFPPARIVKGNPAAEVARLKKERGKDMVLWGSLSIAQALARDGVIDDYQLIICPIVFGSGKPLFSDSAKPRDLKLRSTRPFDRGAVLLDYQP
ncbi:MAG TPA: dihydrofolate reductase family protein [Gemmatimonadaceae bacterium]|nr:dihydrofolate reductase family protein [Gemmatimonadaceae bacterium]